MAQSFNQLMNQPQERDDGSEAQFLEMLEEEKQQAIPVQQESKIAQYEQRVQVLTTQIKQKQAQCLKLKQAGNNQQALEALKEYKQLQVELQNTQQLIKTHSAALTEKRKQSEQQIQKAAQSEVDLQEIPLSLTVLEYESEKQERLGNQEIKAQIDQKIQDLQNQVESGELTMEMYCKGLKKQLENITKQIELQSNKREVLNK